MLKDGIEIHGGKTNPHILLIAPHGYPDPDNDENTGALVREMQKILDCPAIINEVYRKPRKISDDPEEYEKPSLDQQILDLNKRDNAEQHPTYIKKIADSIKDPTSTFVFWIHGIKDENLAEESKKAGSRNPLGCLIGYGQGKSKRFTCDKASVDNLIQAFKSANIAAAPTETDSEKYRGHYPENMNQWFKQSGNGLNRVQSIQLEFGMKGIRDPGSIEKTAQKLASALLSLNGTLKIVPVEKAPDKSLVADSLKQLSGFFNGGYHAAMQQAGDFIIERFYGREPERVIEKKPVLRESLLSLINKLQEGKEKVPSKSWFYNARDLAAHEQIFKNRGFQIFGKLGHSHKLALLHVRDLDKIQTLAKEAIKNGYNVEALKNRIREENGSSGLNLTTVPTKAELAKVERKVQLQLQKTAETKIEHHQKKLAHFQKCLEQINGVLEKSQPVDGKNDKLPVYAKPAKDHPQKEAKRASGFQEWAGKTFSICTGCENDCIYCWAKERAYRFRQVAPDKWKEPILRKHDVDRKHRFYGVRVAFPSTHDILPSNIDAYLVVLRKLLDAGNEVLIVSKPRLDCIRAICDAAKDFKEKILFRFTIGAIDDDILSFWEPNAPKFVERAESLQYAFRNGFRTSVSTEPMLQSSAIEAMAHKLLPHVNDAMWIGKMNYLGRLKKHADKVLASRIAEIEQGQTDERIWAIYNRHKDNPKIKWKDSIKKVVGLKAPSKPGMDI